MTSNKLSLLKGFDIFKDLDEKLLKIIESKSVSFSADKGSVIFKENDMGDKIYFIISGEIVIKTENKQGEELVLAVLYEGGYFGEMAIITDLPRTASAVAKSSCELFYLTKQDFSQLVQDNHSIALELIKNLSKRLSSTNQMLTNKKTNQVILWISAVLTDPQFEAFIKYLSQLTTKKIIIFTGSKLELLNIFEKTNNTIFIIKSPSDHNDFVDIAHKIINCLQPKTGQFYLSPEATTQELEKITRKIANKTIGVALSSGTAHGLAHIGVLKVLQENNIPIDFISGTSGGSLYGAGFAFGYNFKDIYALFSKPYKKPLYRLWDPAIHKSGIFAGKKLIHRTLRKLVGDKNIEDSLIPFAAVATDIFTGKEFIIKQGSLLNAVRASLSIPILFTPVKWEDKLLVDGVVTTPVPVSALEQEGIDIKIAVYVSELEEFERSTPHLMNVFLRARNISADFIADESYENTEVVIKPELSQFKQFDYNKIDEIIKIGEESALKALPRIRRLLAE